jgi:hypothetical protein
MCTVPLKISKLKKIIQPSKVNIQLFKTCSVFPLLGAILANLGLDLDLVVGSGFRIRIHRHN